MTDNDALTPVSLTDALTLANSLAPAETLPMALRKKPADILLAILSGRSLGLDAPQSLRAIHVIEGRVTLSADAMGALVKRSPLCRYLQCVETTAKVATFVTLRQGEPEPTRLSFSLEQAARAGLAGKGNWARYPEAMLRARALSALCRLAYPDILLGVYDPDELDVPAERDVTPATPRASVETLTADLAKKKARRNLVVDATPVSVETPYVIDPAGELPPLVAAGVLTWPEAYAGKALEKLTEKQLAWCVAAAIREIEAGGDGREAWADRLLTLTDEAARRAEVAAT